MQKHKMRVVKYKKGRAKDAFFKSWISFNLRAMFLEGHVM